MIDWEIVSSFDDITHRCGQDRRAYRDSEEVFEGFVVPELWHPTKKIFFILTQKWNFNSFCDRAEGWNSLLKWIIMKKGMINTKYYRRCQELWLHKYSKYQWRNSSFFLILEHGRYYQLNWKFSCWKIWIRDSRPKSMYLLFWFYGLFDNK